MASFTTRVELHDADSEDYEALHKAMKSAGFTRAVRSSEGSRAGTAFALPTAEYNFVGAVTRARVLEKAKQAASKTRKRHAILVTESKGRSWSGLEEV